MDRVSGGTRGRRERVGQVRLRLRGQARVAGRADEADTLADQLLDRTHRHRPSSASLDERRLAVCSADTGGRARGRDGRAPAARAFVATATVPIRRMGRWPPAAVGRRRRRRERAHRSRTGERRRGCGRGSVTGGAGGGTGAAGRAAIGGGAAPQAGAPRSASPSGGAAPARGACARGAGPATGRPRRSRA